MADHQQIMELAKEGALGRQQKRYQDLLTEIDAACATIIQSVTIMLPGRLEEVKEDLAEVTVLKLKKLKAEAVAIKAELVKAGIYVW